MKSFYIDFSKLITLSFLLAFAIAGAAPCLGAEKTLRVQPFDGISAKGPVKVTYRCVPDSAGLAVIENSAFPEELSMFVKKGVLNIKYSGREANYANWPEVTVYSAYVTSLSSEDNARIDARLSTTVPEFSATVTGNGQISLSGLVCTTAKLSLTTGSGRIEASGEAVELTCNLVGTGSIEADGLRAETVRCNATGTGSIGCHAVDILDVRGLGSTRIFYKGSPQVKKTGAAKLSRIINDVEGNDKVATDHEEDDEENA